jgi:hypothetical protein
VECVFVNLSEVSASRTGKALHSPDLCDACSQKAADEVFVALQLRLDHNKRKVCLGIGIARHHLDLVDLLLDALTDALEGAIAGPSGRRTVS